MEAIRPKGAYQVFDFNLSHRVLTLRCSFLVDGQYFNSDIKFMAVQHLNLAIDIGNVLIRLATQEEQVDFASKGYFNLEYSKFLKIYIVESTIDNLQQNYFIVAGMIQIKENYLAPIPLE